MYLDAFVPADGQSTFDFFPAEFREVVRKATQEQGDGWRIPGGDEILDLWRSTTRPSGARVGPKLTPFPLRCFEQSVKLPPNGAAKLGRAYVGLHAPVAELFGQFAEQARRAGTGMR